ncbi:MAG: hypothetical protein ACFFEY_00405 [Candidatus Thorarchaeota archaeon]
MINIEDKSAYPYITNFKKEPFKSFVTVNKKQIRNFYYHDFDKLFEFLQFFNQNLINEPQLTIENVYWFVLLKKYLKEDIKVKRNEIFNFIKKCEIRNDDQIGFKFSNQTERRPDIFSTYLALSSLKNLGLLKEYLFFDEKAHIKEEIKNFVLSHMKGNKFLHCHDKDCTFCRDFPPARILYYVLEIFTLLGVDVRNNRAQFRSYLGDTKKDSSLIFRHLCLKYLGLDLEVKEKEIQLLQQQQQKNGNFIFNEGENNLLFFWLIYDLDLFSWLLDYNPVGIYSYISHNLKGILITQETWDFFKLNKVSKLVILLSLIWKKFIDKVERVVFKQLEKNKFIDINHLKTSLGFEENIEDLIPYINRNYKFNLEIIDNEKEFKEYIDKLEEGKKQFFHIFYTKITNNSIISLSDLFKQYKMNHSEPLRLKEEIFPVIKLMIEKRFLIGHIRAKKFFLGFKTKYLFYLTQLLKKIILSDNDINTEVLYEEKEKLEDIKNDIFNMTLKLKNVGSQIKEEIESYLLINEIEYAKIRLKYVLRNALMEADFLNENIESSFNDLFIYINIQTTLNTEISEWSKLYSVLQKKLSELGEFLNSKIHEKEELRNLKDVLITLKERMDIIEEDLEKKLDSFRTLFCDILEQEYSDENLSLLTQNLDKISQNLRKYDQIIYNVSQKVTTKDKKIIKRHKRIIENWIRIKNSFNEQFNYYIDGFQFFNSYLQKVEEINTSIKLDIKDIEKEAKNKIEINKFHEAFEISKKEFDLILRNRLNEIKEIQSILKQEIKKKQKLYILFRHLQDKLDMLESSIIELISNQIKILKEKIIEERNRSKVKDFDNFVSQESSNLKFKLKDLKKSLKDSSKLTIEIVIKKFDELKVNYDNINKIYEKKLNECIKKIENFREKSEISIIQWEKFSDFFINEISILKEEHANEIISHKLNLMAVEKKTNNIKLSDLKDEVKLSCKVLINKLKNMIEISKINAELNEEEKSILVYTNCYYQNKDLRSYIDNNLLKLNRERIGKILSLYDSSIRNRTLNINMLELQNRISDLHIFKDVLPKQFQNKVKELQINQERQEFLETKDYFDSILENDKIATNNIKKELKLFNKLYSFINQQFNTLNLELKEYVNKVFKETEGQKNYQRIQENFESKKEKIDENLRQSQTKIEEQIDLLFKKAQNSRKFLPEIRELYVKQKNEFLDEYSKKTQKINDYIILLKTESFREKLIALINNNKIYLSQLLGNLERKVEDNLEIKEFKKSNILIQKRAKNIEIEIKKVIKSVDTAVKEYNKQITNFKHISEFMIEDFNKFMEEFIEILNEKVKALERLIIKSYIDMTIKAVANEYLTIGFLNNELKIKKQNIQDHLLFLISNEELHGKYDPRFGIYYENPDILENLDETELEVIKSTNFKFNMMLRHLKNFTSQYGSIIAVFASILTISYYLFLFSGGNPAVMVLPIVVTLLILILYFLRREKDEKIK